MVEHQLPKLVTRVRFPSSAPNQTVALIAGATVFRLYEVMKNAHSRWKEGCGKLNGRQEGFQDMVIMGLLREDWEAQNNG